MWILPLWSEGLQKDLLSVEVLGSNDDPNGGDGDNIDDGDEVNDGNNIDDGKDHNKDDINNGNEVDGGDNGDGGEDNDEDDGDNAEDKNDDYVTQTRQHLNPDLFLAGLRWSKPNLHWKGYGYHAKPILVMHAQDIIQEAASVRTGTSREKDTEDGEE